MPVPKVRVAHPYVVVDAAILDGSPHVAGSRVRVSRLWAWHRGGAAVDVLVKRYPQLGAARVLDALSFAYDHQDVLGAELDLETRAAAAPHPRPPAAQSRLATPCTCTHVLGWHSGPANICNAVGCGCVAFVPDGPWLGEPPLTVPHTPAR